MRFPPNWSMELLLVVALFVSIVIVLFAMQAPPDVANRSALGVRVLDTGLRGFER
jgi:hypothetical protein